MARFAGGYLRDDAREAPPRPELIEQRALPPARLGLPR